LSLDERHTIATMWAAKATKAEIAREIGRHPATVGRELARNSELKSPSHKTPSYHPGRADKRAAARARRPKTCKLRQDVNPRLHGWVHKKLNKKWSPEQIAKDLLLAFPHDLEMRVSYETIYQSLYVQSRGALRRELSVCLRTGRALRKPRRSSTERRGRIPGMVNISQRPAEVADRAVPGHWESDLIIGKDSGSAIGTLVERTTRFVMLLHLPDRHGALEVQEAMLKAIAQMPAELRRSITHDQGTEMANHRQITIASGMDIYFCDPHSPWQRGSNENTNGLLRQYFAKGTDLSVHSSRYLEFVAAELNDRPRKTLGFRTPREKLTELLVATTH
jgi:IS30 family transposase